MSSGVYIGNDGVWLGVYALASVCARVCLEESTMQAMG